MLATLLISRKGKEAFAREIDASTTSLNRHVTAAVDLHVLGDKVLSSFKNTLGVTFSRGSRTAGESPLKELLFREKYQKAAWNCKGSSMCAAVA